MLWLCQPRLWPWVWKHEGGEFFTQNLRPLKIEALCPLGDAIVKEMLNLRIGTHQWNLSFETGQSWSWQSPASSCIRLKVIQ